MVISKEPFLSRMSTNFLIGKTKRDHISSADRSVNQNPVDHFPRVDSRSNEGILLSDAESTETTMTQNGFHVLYTRAFSIASLRKNVTQSVRKAPFLVLTSLMGLWPQNYKLLQIFLVVSGIALNTYNFLGNIFVYRICAVVPTDVAVKLSPWLCYGLAFNQTRLMWSHILGPVLLARSIFGMAQFLGYILMVWCVVKVLPSRKNAVTLNVAYNLLTRNQWTQINLQVLLSFVIWITFTLCDFFQAEQYIPQDHTVFWIKIENVVVWLYTGAPCWIFAVLTHALESLIIACFHEIKELRGGKLDDVIEIYSQLCNHVFSTVRAFKYWFVAHWFLFGMTFIVDVAIGFKAVNVFSKKEDEFVLWVFSIAALFFVLHPFLYPSICAASLTSQCGNMLERINAMPATDWRTDHPFRRRQNVNEFLVFANQAQCGFRVGRLTFNNGLAWLSASFGIFGLVIKLL